MGWGTGAWLDGWMMDDGWRRWMDEVVRWMDQNDCRLVCRALFYRRKKHKISSSETHKPRGMEKWGTGC